MMWNDLLAALALVLVIEGIVPFISPAAVRRMSESMTQLGDSALRIVGMVSMMLGLVMLYLVR